MRCEEAQNFSEEMSMSRHKNPRLNPRNWENLAESDNEEVIGFEKLRHHQQEPQAAGNKPNLKPRQTVQRERPD